MGADSEQKADDLGGGWVLDSEQIREKENETVSKNDGNTEKSTEHYYHIFPATPQVFTELVRPSSKAVGW